MRRRLYRYVPLSSAKFRIKNLRPAVPEYPGRRKARCASGAPADGAAAYTDAQQAALDPVIAANWQPLAAAA